MYFKGFLIDAYGGVNVSQNLDMWGHAIEIMQYTGLKDKNGKEIYEGDILRWTNSVEDSFELYEVLYREDLAAYVTRLIGRKVTPELTYFNTGMIEDTETDEIEVIGNIYENPDLL